jgi:hypothetical protein
VTTWRSLHVMMPCLWREGVIYVRGHLSVSLLFPLLSYSPLVNMYPPWSL